VYAFRSDMMWWQLFATHWNGASLIIRPESRKVHVSITSGSWGCGAWYEREWFQLAWDRGHSYMYSTSQPELILTVIGAVVGGVPGKVAESWPTVTIPQF